MRIYVGYLVIVFLGLMSISNWLQVVIAAIENYKQLVLISDVIPWFESNLKQNLTEASLYFFTAHYVYTKWVDNEK